VQRLEVIICHRLGTSFEWKLYAAKTVYRLGAKKLF